MANHFSILAWRIPWTEEPGGLSPWGRTELDMTEELALSCIIEAPKSRSHARSNASLGVAPGEGLQIDKRARWPLGLAPCFTSWVVTPHQISPPLE